MGNDIVVSEYCLFRLEPGSREVVLVFSEVNTGPGRFTGYRVFQGVGRTVVFLNCPSDWYIHGVPGLGNDPETTVRALRRLMDEHVGQVDRIVTYGGSMGGYGALLYGALLPADRAVACGAETVLNIPYGHSRKHLKGEQFFIRPLLERSSCRFDLYFGEFCFFDMVCAMQVADIPSVRVTTVANRDHAVPGYLHARYGLDRMVDASFRGESFLLSAKDTGSYLDHPELIRLAMALRVAAGKGKSAPFASVVERAGAVLSGLKDPLIKSYVLHQMSLGYGDLGDMVLALACAERAHENNSANMAILSRLALCLLWNGEPAEAQEMADKALAMHDPALLDFAEEALAVSYMAHMELAQTARARRVLDRIGSMRWNSRPSTIAKDAHKTYARFLLEGGRNEEAARELEQAIGHKPENPSLHLMLSRALERLGRIKEALGAARRAAGLAGGGGRYERRLEELLSGGRGAETAE